MKNRTITELGYYHPSNANWSYHIFLVFDQTGARIYKATFGGESRTRVKLENLPAGRGTGVAYKWKDIKNCPDILDYNGYNWGDE